jgi:hypothetical protein
MTSLKKMTTVSRGEVGGREPSDNPSVNAFSWLVQP